MSHFSITKVAYNAAYVYTAVICCVLAQLFRLVIQCGILILISSNKPAAVRYMRATFRQRD